MSLHCFARLHQHATSILDMLGRGPLTSSVETLLRYVKWHVVTCTEFPDRSVCNAAEPLIDEKSETTVAQLQDMSRAYSALALSDVGIAFPNSDVHLHIEEPDRVSALFDRVRDNLLAMRVERGITSASMETVTDLAKSLYQPDSERCVP